MLKRLVAFIWRSDFLGHVAWYRCTPVHPPFHSVTYNETINRLLDVYITMIEAL